MTQSIHPAVDSGIQPRPARRNIWSYINNKPKPGGTLTCKCSDKPVVVRITATAAHNHLCGCTQCWKPEGALFSQVAVVPRDRLEVIKNADKLTVANPGASVQRHVCSGCGTHMFGRVEDEHHHFFGLDFVHLELSKDEGWPPVQFAGFVSSLVESGTDPGELDAIRDRIRALGLKPYDAFSPELDAYIASNASKLSYKNKVY